MRKFSRIIGVCAALCVALPLIGVSGAAGGARAADALPAQLSGAQIHALADGAGHPVIVVLKNQHPEFSGRENLQARASAIRAEQTPVLNQLTQVGVQRVQAFHLINAIAATVTSSEEAHLRAQPSVSEVVPDEVIRRPQLAGASALDGAAQAGAVAKGTSSKADPATSACSSGTPTLEPEALQLTNTAFTDSSTPQAQSFVTGKGVKVAFMAEGINTNNPEFIRPDHSKVFTIYKDFSGDGPTAPTSGGEAFIDASSIAAQGKLTYDVNQYMAAGTNQHSSPCLITIRGMAPGASLIGLKIFGTTNQTFLSSFVQAIQYAVDVGADVLNESFGVFNQEQRNDIVSMADDQAVQAGVTVIASSGDSGPGNTISAPASDPNVISVGATTQLRAYQQGVLYGSQLSNGSWTSNNISGLSSSGISPDGRRTIDVVAGGDLSWAACTANVQQYSDCTALDGKTPSSFIISGGTSESAPLVAGEAALIIQAFRKTHKGASPSPQLVRQFIMGTAQDLNIPSSEQGAGLIDSLRAVQAAMAYKGAHGATPAQDSSLLTSPTSLSAIGKPGSSTTASVQVMNNTSHSQDIYAAIRKLGAPFGASQFSVNLDEANSPTFTDSSGFQRAYVTHTFNVPAGADRLDASISWDVVKDPGTVVRITLLDPQGTYVAYSIPQDFAPEIPITSGYGHVDVRNPVQGAWTAVIWTRGRDSAGYTGTVHVSESASKFQLVQGSSKAPPLHLGAWQTGTMKVPLKTPTTPGDAGEDLVLSGTQGAITGGFAIVPITLRSLIPLGASGGTFKGTLTGGNGRPDSGPTQTFNFDVPAGLKDIDLGISLADPNYNLEGFLSDPNGLPVDTQSTVTNLDSKTGLPTGYTNTMQFFRRDPQPGLWRFSLAIDDNISGAQTSLPFTGKIVFNGVKVSAANLPTSTSTVIPAGQSVSAKISVTNTGITGKQFFVDPRLVQADVFNQITPENTLPIDVKQSQPLLLVPPACTGLSIVSTSTVPLAMDVVNAQGTPPFDFTFNPDLRAAPSQDQSTHLYQATATMFASEVPFGIWLAAPQEYGPYGASGAQHAPVETQAACDMQPFDTSVMSSTGDPWSLAFDPNAQNSDYSPLYLPPGQSGTISVTITPGSGLARGTVVKGIIYVDTLKFPNGFFSYEVDDFGGDELVGIPYTYTVG